MKFKKKIKGSITNQNKVSIWPLFLMVTIIVIMILGFIVVHALRPPDVYRDFFHLITSLLFMGLMGLAFYEIVSKNLLLKKIETRNRVFFNLASELPFGIIIFDHQQEIEYLNDWMKNMISQNPKDKIVADILKCSENPEPNEVNERVNSQGQSFFFTVLKQSYEDVKGNKHAVILVNDVTVSQYLKNKEIQNEKMETFSQLTRAISHDFNNLLMGIGGHAAMLAQSDETHNEHVDKIIYTTNLASQLVEKLSMASSESEGFNPQLTSIADRIRQAQNHFSYNINQTILLEIEEGVEDLKIFGDPVLIESAFINLIKNALEAMDNQGTVKVNLTREKIEEFNESDYILPVCQGEFLKVTFRDEGKGVVGKIDKIFDPLFTTKTLGVGHGIGLTAVYHILEQHHAGLRVSKNKDKGMLFDIYFPYKIKKTGHHSRKIAILEDDEIIVELLKGTLKDEEIKWLNPNDDLSDYQILITDLGIHESIERFIFETLNQYPHLIILVISGCFSQEELTLFNHYANVYALKKPINLICFKELINFLDWR